MPIPNRFPIEKAVRDAQRRRIERCRSAAVFVEISKAFETASPTELEKLIDGATGKDKEGFSMFSGKYRRMIELSEKRPVASIGNATVDKIDRKSKGKANVLHWLRHSLFDLLEEPPLSSSATHQILVGSPSWIRHLIFVEGELVDPPIRDVLPRYALGRDTILEIRNRKTLDAFVALLALAREAEHSSHQQEHVLPVACAREIFPVIIRNYPHLRARWMDLYECLATSFWSRIYLSGGMCMSIKPFDALEGIIAVLRNPRNPKLPFSMGITSAEVRRRSKK